MAHPHTSTLTHSTVSDDRIVHRHGQFLFSGPGQHQSRRNGAKTLDLQHRHLARFVFAKTDSRNRCAASLSCVAATWRATHSPATQPHLPASTAPDSIATAAAWRLNAPSGFTAAVHAILVSERHLQEALGKTRGFCEQTPDRSWSGYSAVSFLARRLER